MKTSSAETVGAHPSFLALDRAHLGLLSAEVTAHLGACDECRRYVEEPASSASAAGLAAVRSAASERRPRATVSRWFAAASAVVAAAAALFFVIRPAQQAADAPTAYVGVKGFRSVWIYVKRGNDTELWDGKRQLLPGDRLRLKVDPGGYRRVAVYSLDDAGRAESLFGGALTPGESFTLPDAWEVDASPAPERLFVVFSDVQVELDGEQLRAGQVPKGVAVLPFVLTKFGALDDAGQLSP